MLSVPGEMHSLQDFSAQKITMRDICGPAMLQDCWLDAKMDEVLAYLRSDRYLDLSDRLRRALPTEIPPQA